MAWVAIGILLYLSVGCFLAGLGEAFRLSRGMGMVVVSLWPFVLLVGLGRYVALRVAPLWKQREGGE